TSFAARYGIPDAHGSYQTLIDDARVDCVYLALPNHLHLEWTARAARAGKHVLCEKPLAMNAREAAEAIAAAAKHEVVLLEAFMYRMHPQMTELARLLQAGTIGEVRMVEASFGGNMRGGYSNYRMQRAAGGGALMDLGCYGVSLARLVAGAQAGQPFADPASILATARIGDRSGVDEWSAAILDFDGPMIATVICGNQVDITSQVRIWGSEGSIELTEPWEAGKRDRPGSIVLRPPGTAGAENRVIEADRPLYALEADAFADAVWHGRVPAPVMTTDDSLGNMRALDQWRRSVGLRFAQDLDG
ncbi:MAG: Gfo/Idh/MocA family oxidoreductase, partial [Actinobacteria bacterium]|nr:Gfo/Idh/MocA family oxidoreductase [Actinomycetota bacterium]